MVRSFNKKVYAKNGANWILSSEKKFVYDGYKQIGEYAGATATMLTVWQPESSGDFDVPLWSKTGTEVQTYIVDGNKNVRQLKNAAGTPSPRQFSSEYRDAETGLVYYNYRYYAPAIGRWLTRDPIFEVASPAHRVSILRRNYLQAKLLSMEFQIFFGRAYCFVNNSPTSNNDINGLAVAPIIGVGTLLIGGAVCAKTQANIAHEKFPDSADLFKHCWTSCRMSKICGGFFTELAGLSKEGMDSVKRTWIQVFGGEDTSGAGSWIDSLEDIIANQQCIGWEAHTGLLGAWIGAACRQSCEDYCREKVGYKTAGHD